MISGAEDKRKRGSYLTLAIIMIVDIFWQFLSPVIIKTNVMVVFIGFDVTLMKWENKVHKYLKQLGLHNGGLSLQYYVLLW